MAKKDNKTLPGPASERQLMYMQSTADVTLYGGAAGSGKSEIGIIDLLQYTDIKNFIAVLTRRTTPQLNGPGGVLSKCKRIFSQVYEPDEYTWRAKDGKFVFHNSGAEVYLKHFENDDADANWQGTEANLYYVDESTQFTQHMIQYIMSRMRNPSCPDVSPRLKMSCNPVADHFLRKWVEPYLNEDGTPDRTKDGLVRYFSFIDGDFVFADSKKALVDEYGISEQDALSFTFISANVDDNPILKKINPKYVSWLKGLKGVERARLLEGNWYVRESGSGYFKREMVQAVKLHEQDIVSYCRAWDLAGSLPSDLNPNPDYTVGVLMGKTRDDRYVIIDVVRFRARYGEVQKRIIETALTDPQGTILKMPQEPGQAGKSAAAEWQKAFLKEGLYASFNTTNQKKIVRFQPFVSACETGLVDYIEDEWNESFFTELEIFDGSRGNKDDQVDAVGDAFITLASKRKAPSFNPSTLQDLSFTTSNPFF